MVNDSISDLLTRIKNGYFAKHKSITVPYFKLGEDLVNILHKEGYLKEVKVDKKAKEILIDLRYEKKAPAITNIVRVSKPGLRVYVGKTRIPRVLGGAGITILSTNKGLLTGSEAKKQKAGGEVLCKVW